MAMGVEPAGGYEEPPIGLLPRGGMACGTPVDWRARGCGAPQGLGASPRLLVAAAQPRPAAEACCMAFGNGKPCPSTLPPAPPAPAGVAACAEPCATAAAVRHALLAAECV